MLARGLWERKQQTAEQGCREPEVVSRARQLIGLPGCQSSLLYKDKEWSSREEAPGRLCGKGTGFWEL